MDLRCARMNGTVVATYPTHESKVPAVNRCRRLRPGRGWRTVTDVVRLATHESAKAGIGRESTMKNFFATLWTDDSGQDMAEYALLLVLIAVVVAVAVIALRGAITNGFNRATGQLNAAPT